MRLLFVDASWFERARPFIKQIAEGSGGRLTEELIHDALKANDFWLAVAVKNEEVRAAMIAKPLLWKTGLKELEIVGLTGVGMKDWLHLDTELKAHAKRMGFDLLRPVARTGWSRVMKSRGYTTTHVIMEHRLADR